MFSLSFLSERLYVHLCDIFGTKEEVAIRRDICDIAFMQRNLYLHHNNENYRKTESGSHREGFRLSDSDIDMMVWFSDHKVLCDLSQAKYYNSHKETLVLMTDEDTKPGFFLLKLLSTSNINTLLSCVAVNNDIYISSTLHKQFITCPSLSNSTLHGPCISGYFFGQQYDFAYCFSSDFWPPITYPWINRSKTRLPPSVLQDIIRSGCHFVAIGSRGSPYEHIEWRISFSLAEQKLVYNMNHCQFLVYGLLKLFLKQVINQGVNDNLLCSYFMKSVVFWEIQDNDNSLWCPQTILHCFWRCFKRLIHWAYSGVCPNFFIPKNNMFSGKIVGQSQECLFQKLYELYEMGPSCLLNCESIRPHLIKLLYHPTDVIDIDQMHMASKNDYTLWNEIHFYNKLYKKSWFLMGFKIIELLKQKDLTNYQAIYLHINLNLILQHLSFYLHNMYKKHGNRIKYIQDKKSCHMLKLTVKYGPISDILYLGMYYYKTFRYKKALHIIETAKKKLSQSHVITVPGLVPIKKYAEVVWGKSWFTKIKAVILDFKLHPWVHFIDELQLEQNLSQKGSLNMLAIPPFVFLYMLSVLCYNQINRQKRQEALDDLYRLLHYDDDNIFIKHDLRDISWHVLGICQEVCEDWRSALHSFKASHRSEPHHEIQRATEVRMQHVLTKINPCLAELINLTLM